MLKLCPVPPAPSSQFSITTQPPCVLVIRFRAGLRPGGGAAAVRVSGFGVTSQSPTQKSNWRYSAALQSYGFGGWAGGGGCAACRAAKTRTTETAVTSIPVDTFAASAPLPDSCDGLFACWPVRLLACKLWA